MFEYDVRYRGGKQKRELGTSMISGAYPNGKKKSNKKKKRFTYKINKQLIV